MTHAWICLDVDCSCSNILIGSLSYPNSGFDSGYMSGMGGGMNSNLGGGGYGKNDSSMSNDVKVNTLWQ